MFEHYHVLLIFLLLLSLLIIHYLLSKLQPSLQPILKVQ